MPNHSATVCVAFAAMGGTPVNSNAGNAMNPPPPATEFSAPASIPVRKRKMAWPSVKLQVYHGGAGSVCHGFETCALARPGVKQVDHRAIVGQRGRAAKLRDRGE